MIDDALKSKNYIMAEIWYTVCTDNSMECYNNQDLVPLGYVVLTDSLHYARTCSTYLSF